PRRRLKQRHQYWYCRNRMSVRTAGIPSGRYARNLRRASGLLGQKYAPDAVRRRKPTPLPEASRVGFRSRLVLAKLGFDLRQRYDALLGRELPDELGRLASQLNPNVVEVGKEPKRRGSRWSNHWP